MMKAFEHIGVWWDPRAPDTQWPGTLRFDPVQGASLARTMPADPARWFGEGREFDVLHGETATGGDITLLNCFERGGDEVFANGVIVGFHAATPDPPVLVAAAVVEQLREWWGQSALAHDPSLKFPSVGARYTQPQTVEVHDDGVMRIAICSSPLSEFSRSRVAIEEEIRIEVTTQSPQPLSVLRARIHACQDMLSVASLTLCNVEELRLVPPVQDGERKAIGQYYAVPVFKDPSERWAEFLFRYADVAPRVGEVFTAWLRNAERLSAVRSLYMSAAYGKSFLELRLLAFAQAAEAFHRRVYEGQDRYMDPTDYEKDVLPQLQAAIPATLQPSHRQALASRVKFGNEFSFRRRLTALFEEHEAALAVVVPSPSDWIGRIVDYRNNLTHYPVVSEPPGLNRLELVRCNYVLRILLELCFLKSMSIGASDIAALASRCSRYGQIRQRFFR